MHDKPSLSYAEAVAVGRAMLQCAELMANNGQSDKDESKLITYKDIAAPAKVGDNNPPLPPIQHDIFSSSIADVQIPSFSEPYVTPYRCGFDLSALDNVVNYTTPTVQDMSNLVLDNARFSGEAMDDQDRQWYPHHNLTQSTIVSSRMTLL